MKYPCLLTKKISEISPAKYNPRKISDEAMGRLTKSLAEFGNIQPITWNARTGNVVGGHQRLKVYQAMGKTEVEVWAVDLDEQKEKAANIALNKLAGEFDLPALKDILEDIDTGNLDLEITGFGINEIAEMMEQIPDPNFAPGTEEEQGQLDEKCPIVCPKCGNEFTK
jgi:ParB-like chromosome segregation protein Spo0J